MDETKEKRKKRKRKKRRKEERRKRRNNREEREERKEEKMRKERKEGRKKRTKKRKRKKKTYRALPPRYCITASAMSRPYDSTTRNNENPPEVAKAMRWSRTASETPGRRKPASVMYSPKMQVEEGGLRWERVGGLGRERGTGKEEMEPGGWLKKKTCLKDT